MKREKQLRSRLLLHKDVVRLLVQDELKLIAGQGTTRTQEESNVVIVTGEPKATPTICS